MSNTSRLCYLLNTESKKKIILPHGETKILGRNVDTEVQDLYVSKNQIECTADTEKYQVKLKPVGKALSGIDGYAITKDKTYTVGHGHRIELRLGRHMYEIIFEPVPESGEECTHVAKKQKIDFPMFNLKKAGNEEITLPSVGGWNDVDRKELLIYTSENCTAASKIAAFDMDGTIIKTKSGARFPKDADDWDLNFHDIPKQLKKLKEDGYKIVFFTNQSGVGKEPYKIKEFKRKIENIVAKLSLPIQVFVALGKSIYRKPAPGMWNFCVDLNDGISIDMESTFYVGDAAGRDKNWAPKKNKDHSSADRLFAINVGIKFFTPEEYFLKAKQAPYVMPEFDPRQLPADRYPDINYNRPNVILMVGGPGSGKSHFCKKVLIPMGYLHINRDKLGSWQKCVKALKEGLADKKNCVVDNTNPDKESRARFIEVAKKMNVNCYGFVMATTVRHMKHNNKFRELTDTSHVAVSDIIINSYHKNFQELEMTEGFVEIVRIPFVAEFDNADHEKLYKMFLLEK